MANVQITELALRDAHQSLLATRMKLSDMLPVAKKLDAVGYWSIEVWGGATFDTCIRYLNEDPWDRLRALHEAMPNTRLQMLLRGQNAVGYRHYADDVVEAFVERAAENGISIFRVFDALNDLRNLKVPIAAVKECQQWAEGSISYTTSPVHSVDMFIDQAKELEDMGCDSICIKDMAGLLTPWDADALVSGLKEQVGLPIHLHCHSTTGLAEMSILKAVEAGCEIVDTSISSLSGGPGHPATESIIAALQDSEYDTGLDLAPLVEIAEHFRGIRKSYSRFESALRGVDARILAAQVPGGMLTNLENQLRKINEYDKMDAVLAEIADVRNDFGYVPLVTPTSQIVGTQAVFNVMNGRYKVFTNESKDLLAGRYGKTPAPINPEVLKLAELDDGSMIECRPADLIEPEMEKLDVELRKKINERYRGIEDTLTYAMFPEHALQFFETRDEVVFEEPEDEGDLGVENAKTIPTSSARRGAESYIVAVNGVSYHVQVAEDDGTGAVPISSMVALPAPAASAAPAPAAAPAAPPPEKAAPAAKPAKAAKSSAAASAGGTAIEAPLPGSVTKILVSVGDSVQSGQTVLMLEAMKMEMDVKASVAGKIAGIDVAVGDAVEAGATLLSIS